VTDVSLDLSPPSLCAHAQPSTYQGVKPRSRAPRPPLQLLLAGLVPGLHNDCGVGHCGVGHPCTLQIISQRPDRRRQRGYSPSHKGVRRARNQGSKTCPTEVACVGSSKLVLVTTHRQAAEHQKADSHTLLHDFCSAGATPITLQREFPGPAVAKREKIYFWANHHKIYATADDRSSATAHGVTRPQLLTAGCSCCDADKMCMSSALLTLL
jgi:hypothetical protein